jgi:hypothetical protein
MPLATDHASRMAALARANEIRSRRSCLKAAMKTGEVLLADVLLSEEDWLQTMRVREILLAAPGIGAVKAGRALQACLLSPTIALGRLTRQRRKDLAALLAERSPNLTLSREAA